MNWLWAQAWKAASLSRVHLIFGGLSLSVRSVSSSAWLKRLEINLRYHLPRPRKIFTFLKDWYWYSSDGLHLIDLWAYPATSQDTSMEGDFTSCKIAHCWIHCQYCINDSLEYYQMIQIIFSIHAVNDIVIYVCVCKVLCAFKNIIYQSLKCFAVAPFNSIYITLTWYRPLTGHTECIQLLCCLTQWYLPVSFTHT